LDASSVKATIPILLLIALVAGCQSALDVYESKAALTAVVSTNTNGALSLAWRHLPSEVMLVTGAVQRVELPLVNSPSLAGDKATCILLVPARSIPAHPDFSRVALHYDNHGWLQDLKPGTKLVLRFLKDGEFDGVQLPTNFIQQTGAASGSQPIRSETNPTSSAAGSRR
jgi:hypothetical protein